MALVAHERDLVKSPEGNPLALVGVSPTIAVLLSEGDFPYLPEISDV